MEAGAALTSSLPSTPAGLEAARAAAARLPTLSPIAASASLEAAWSGLVEAYANGVGMGSKPNRVLLSDGMATLIAANGEVAKECEAAANAKLEAVTAVAVATGAALVAAEARADKAAASKGASAPNPAADPGIEAARKRSTSVSPSPSTPPRPSCKKSRRGIPAQLWVSPVMIF